MPASTLTNTEHHSLVSVIIPAFNAEACIGRTIESVITQTYRHMEIIVVDDASTDRTAEIVDAYAQRDDRIRVFRCSHRGIPATRNFAASKANGDWIAPVDNDDLWHRTKIERQMAALHGSGGSVGVVYCWSVGINENDAVVFPDFARATATGKVWEAMVANNLPGHGSSPLIRRACFDAVGGYPEDNPRSDDWQLYIALADICEFALVPQHLVGYRLRADSSSRHYRLMEASVHAMTHWIVERWPEVSRKLLSRRTYNAYCYLAFVAARQGDYIQALKYRMTAYRARPAMAFTPSSLGFILLMIGQRLGIHRYYNAFWRTPLLWEGARHLHRDES